MVATIGNDMRTSSHNVHPLVSGARVRVGAFYGKVLVADSHPVNPDVYQYQVLFDDGRVAPIDQYWVIPAEIEIY